MADVAESVEHAHRHSFLHRDLKPSNIMVDVSGESWVIDFGLAGYVGGELERRFIAENHGDGESSMALTAGVIGTPGYLSPEQALGKELDARTDVWGLGATLYELVTWRRAYPNTIPTRDSEGAWFPRPLAPRRLVNNAPRDLEAICLKALEVAPEGRYSGAAEFGADLRRWLRGEPTTARPAGAVRRMWLWAGRNKGWAAAIASSIVAVVLVVIGIILYLGAAATAAEHREAAAKEQTRLARESELASQRESYIQQLQRIRLTEREAGWSEDAWELVRKAASIKRDANLRDQAAATLVGLDAHRYRQRDSAASSVAFDSTGRRLLLGGMVDHAEQPPAPAVLWDMDSDEAIRSQQTGAGPVAFDRQAAPLQLLAQDRSSFLLWNVKLQRAVGQYALSADAPSESPDGSVAEVLDIALSADGSLLAASIELPAEAPGRSPQATVAVWRASESEPWHRFDARATALAIAPSSDAPLLAAGDEGGEVTIWELDSGRKAASLRSGRNAIQCLAFDRDRRRTESDPAAGDRGPNWLVAAGDAGGTVTIWDVGAEIPRAYCRGSRYHVYAVAFSPDGMTLASAGRYRAKLWDVATGKLLLHLKYRNSMTALGFSPDGRRLAVASVAAFDNPSAVDVWQLEEGSGVRLLRGLLGQVTRLALSPDDRYLAALSDDWQVGVWDIKAAHLLHVLAAPKGITADNAALAFSPDGSQLAFAAGHEARLWDVGDGTTEKSWTLPDGQSDQLAFPTLDKLLLLRVETREGDRGPFNNVPPSEHPRVCRLRNLLGAESRDKGKTGTGSRLLSKTSKTRREARVPVPVLSGSLGAESVDKGVEITEFNWGVFSTTLAPDGSYFVVHGLGGSRGERRMIKIFNAAGRELHEIPTERTMSSGGSLIDPSGTRLLIDVDDAGRCLLLEMPSIRPLGYLRTRPYCFSRDGTQYVTSGAPGGRAIGCSGETEPFVTLGIDTPTAMYDARFSSDGRLAAWGNADGTVLVGDLPAVRSRLTEVGLGW